MEPMVMDLDTFVKPLLFVPAVVAGLYLLALRPWRLRSLWARMSLSLDGFFLCMLALSCAAVMAPMPFDRGAAYLVDQTSLPDTLASVDLRMSELEDMPQRLWQDLKARIGFDVAPADVPPAIPLERPGAVEAAVLDAVHEIVSMLLRAWAWAGGLLIAWIALVMRLFTGGRVRTGPPDDRERRLLDRIDALENEIAGRSAPVPALGSG